MLLAKEIICSYFRLQEVDFARSFSSILTIGFRECHADVIYCKNLEKKLKCCSEKTSAQHSLKPIVKILEKLLAKSNSCSQKWLQIISFIHSIKLSLITVCVNKFIKLIAVLEIEKKDRRAWCNYYNTYVACAK